MCKCYLYFGIIAFALNLALLGGLFDLIPLMGFIGDYCSECSHSLLSDICTSFAAHLLMECELLTLQLFGANCNFVTLSGICDANGCLKCGLILELVSGNCVANGVVGGERSDCDAKALWRSCELVFSNLGSCGANGRLNLCEGKFDFNMLLNFLVAFCLFVIRCFIESRIFDIVATTKCSSYADILLALAYGFLEI